MTESERPQNANTIWRRSVVCWISKATRVHAHALARARARSLAPTRTHTEICNACFAPVFVDSDFSSDGVFLESGLSTFWLYESYCRIVGATQVASRLLRVAQRLVQHMTSAIPATVTTVLRIYSGITPPLLLCFQCCSSNLIIQLTSVDRDNSVGIATLYGLDNPGIQFR
jgi:hypothetical protein